MKTAFNRTYLRTSPQKGVSLTRIGQFQQLKWNDYRFKKMYGLEISVKGISFNFWEDFGLLSILLDFGVLTRFSRISRDMSKLTHGHLFKY